MTTVDRKYGRTKDDYTRPKLDLTAFAASADFSTIPPIADYLAELHGGWQMLGNDAAGDCEAVRWANHRRLMGAAYPPISQVWQVYKTQNPDFDPNGSSSTNGPGSDADRGMSSDDLLDHLHKNGGPDGVKVIAYGTIDPQNVQAVERAIGAFGGVWVDILVQPGNQDEFDRGQAWTNTGEQPEGGHAVLAGGYVPQRKFITWAAETEFADSFWAGKVGSDALVERVYLVVWPEHASRRFVQSETGQLLASQYQALTGKTLVWPGAPTPTPTPTPTPAPTPGPGAPFPVSAEVAARIRSAAARAKLTDDAWLEHRLRSYFQMSAQ